MSRIQHAGIVKIAAFIMCLKGALGDLTFPPSVHGVVREEVFALPKPPSQRTRD